MNLSEAPKHAHNTARAAFVRGVNGDLAPGPAPRLSRTPGACSSEAPAPGRDSDAVLAELDLSDSEIATLRREAVIA
jgi:alpha-methylacyl-CoA racemase